MTKPVRRSRQTERSIAAGLWLAIGAIYLVTEGLAASAFIPSYSYAHNYISELGIEECGQIFMARAVCSPLHGLINAGFVIQGLLFAAAAVVVARCITSRVPYALVGVAVAHGIGIVLVGFFHDSAAAQINAIMQEYHVLGAFLAIVAGNGTALLFSAFSEELGLPPFYRFASVGLPIVGLAAVIVMMIAQARGTILVPEAVWERISVYTITAWEIVSGVCLLATPRG